MFGTWRSGSVVISVTVLTQADVMGAEPITVFINLNVLSGSITDETSDAVFFIVTGTVVFVNDS